MAVGVCVRSFVREDKVRFRQTPSPHGGAAPTQPPPPSLPLLFFLKNLSGGGWLGGLGWGWGWGMGWGGVGGWVDGLSLCVCGILWGSVRLCELVCDSV